MRFVVAAGYTLFSTSRPEPVPAPPRYRRVRPLLTAGAALWVLLLNFVIRPGIDSTYSGLATVWITGVGVTTVLLTLVHPLWAWRGIVVLLAVSPFYHAGLARDTGWPWLAGTMLAAAAVLYFVAETYHPNVVAWVFVYTSAVLALHVRDWRDMLFLSAFVVVLMVLGNTLRARRIAEAGRQLQAERSALLEERARIARELHDIVAHHMSVLVLRAGSARYRFPDLPQELVDEFDEMQNTAREGMAEMRRLLGVLRHEAEGAEVAPQPGVEQIAELVDRLRSAGVVVSLEISGNVQAAPQGVALSAYRIVQEALSNAVRHAPGSTVDVRVAVESDLRLTVGNTAHTEPPPPPDDRPKHGLLGMRERVATLGGTFRAGPAGDGFEVAVTLPLNGG